MNHKLHNGDIEEGEEEEEEEEEDAESSYSHITSSESLKAQEDSDTPLASLEAQVPEEPNGKPRPHGLVCVREVLRFLVSITDPRDTSSNSPRLMATGLGLVSVALEVGCKELNRFPSLLAVVGNRLCRHMIMVCVHPLMFVCPLMCVMCVSPHVAPLSANKSRTIRPVLCCSKEPFSTV